MALLISASASVALPTCKGSPASEWDKILGGRNFIKSNWHNCIGDHEEKNKYISGKHHSLRHDGRPPMIPLRLNPYRY